MKDWHQALVDTFDVLRGKGCKNNNEVVEKQVHGYDTWERESLKNERTLHHNTILLRRRF
ncbi:MAG: hypothetical protein ACLS9K_05600 [Lachnospira eligens]